MRYLVAEKLEIIRLVEQSHLPVRRTLRHLDIPPATFYRWCERFQAGGTEALADRPSRPDRVWNRIPEAVRGHILELALAEPDLSGLSGFPCAGHDDGKEGTLAWHDAKSR